MLKNKRVVYLWIFHFLMLSSNFRLFSVKGLHVYFVLVKT